MLHFKNILKNTEKLLFFALLFLMPLNLGKHFIANWAYVNGLLIDYLIPTIFVQDILVVTLLILWFFRGGLGAFSHAFLQDFGLELRVLFLFVFTVFLSVLGSINLTVSVYAFLQLFLYVFFALYIALNIKKIFKNPPHLSIMYVFAFSTFLLSLFALGQWYLQSSVFNNYLFFGEQPYNFSTYGIARESFFGRAVIPPYGTFRHPNILGGFLSLLVVFMLGSLTKTTLKKSLKWFFLVFSILLAITVILLTFSWVAFFALIAGIILCLLFEKIHFNRLYGIFILLPFIFAAFTLPILTNTFFSSDPSFYRRVQLYSVAADVLAQRPLFGVGLNASTIFSAGNFKFYDEIKHPQPVHNIFLLIFTESGVFALVFFVAFLVLVLFKAPPLVFIALIQFIILGLFDHYVVTIHQTILLFWFFVGLGLCSKFKI